MQDREEGFDFSDFEYFIELETYSRRAQLRRDNHQKSLSNQQTYSQLLFKRNNDPRKIQKFMQRTLNNDFSEKEICELVLKELDELDLTKSLSQLAEVVLSLPITPNDVPFLVEVCCRVHQFYKDFARELQAQLQKVLRGQEWED